jgi:cytochrome c
MVSGPRAALAKVLLLTLLGQIPFAADAQDAAPSAPPASASAAKLFRTCKACHSIEQDGEDGLGPNLWNVAGAKAARRADFPYSEALRNSGLVWTDENLDQWLSGPSKFVPGTKMAYAGNPNAAERAALIAYLKAHSG